MYSNSSAQNIQFTDITKSSNVRGYQQAKKFVFGHGVALADISGDSLVDIYVSNAARNENLPELLYISTADGPYEDEASVRGVDDQYGNTGSHGIVFVDIDNDGDFDIFNGSTDERNRLYRNKGNGYFDDITNQAGIENVHLGTRGVVALDADADGFMDLYAVNWNKDFLKDKNELYINNGDGTFTRKDGGATSINQNGKGVQGVTAIDVENDGDMDIYITRRPYPDISKSVPNQLLINDGDGHFTDEADIRFITDAGRAGNGTTFADYDNDGDLDAFVVSTRKHWTNDAPFLGLFRNRGDGYFDDLTEEIHIHHDGFSAVLFDVDNDADLDYFALRSEHDEPCNLYLNDGLGNFEKATDTGLEIATRDARGAGVADIDNDGDLDLYFACKNYENNQPASDGRNYLLRNDTENTNRWLKIFVRGPKGDMGGFGSRIWLFDSGHLDDLNHLIGFKQVTNAYGYLCQDDPIQHFGLAQRNECDVKVRMLDGTTLVLPGVEAEQLIYFSKPNQIVKTEGDEQEGCPSSTLPQAFEVTVENAYGDKVPGAGIIFEVISGGGSLSSQGPIYSDLKGQASVWLTLGPMPGENVVRATIPGMDIQAVEFTALAIGDTPAELVESGGNHQTGYVDTWLSDSVKVRIVDTQGDGVQDYKVKFEVMTGGGVLNSTTDTVLDITTNTAGYAAVSWKLGVNADLLQHLQVSVLFRDSHITGSPMTFEATALPGPSAQLITLRGDGQVGTVGLELPLKIEVAVEDSWGNPKFDEIVHFEVIAGDGLVSGQPEVDVETDEGYASVIWQLGTIAGENQEVRISTPSLPDTFLVFTAESQAGSPAHMSPKSAVEFTGIVGQPIDDSLCVFVSDEFGNAVADFSVHFEIIAGGGSIGSTEIDVPTDTAGMAYCWLTLGTVAGENNNIVAASAVGVADSPVQFCATALPDNPKNISKVSGDGQHGFINETLNQPLTVVVSDRFSNDIVGHPVVFEVIEGQGTFNGETLITINTDANGEASAYLTLGLVPEDIVVRVFSQYQGTDLEGSPLDFTVVAVNRPIDLQASFINATSPVVANGCAQSTITVHLKDDLGNFIQGIDVSLGATGTDIALVQPILPTNENGQTIGYLSSTALGVKKVWATVADTLVVSDSAEVMFVVGGAFQIHKVSGDNQTAVIGRQVPKPLKVFISNSMGFGIANYPVEFAVITGSGSPQEPVTILTDQEGKAVFTGWILGQKPGIHQLQASAEGLQGSPVIFNAQGVLGTPASIQVVSGNNQNGEVGTVLPDSFVVSVKDSVDFLMGIPVHFELISGQGQFISPQIDTTDQAGLARTYFRFGSNVGEAKIVAWVDGLADSAVFICYAWDRTAAKVLVISGQNQQGRANEPLAYPLQVLVTDSDDNPMSEIDVWFSVKMGGGRIVESQPVSSNDQGVAQVHWVLGPKGSQLVVATIEGVSDTARFAAQISENQAPILSFPRDTTGYEMEELSFTIIAIDPEDDSLLIGIQNIPDQAAFNNRTGFFSWVPNYNQAGDYEIIFSAQDEFGASSHDTSFIHILNVNQAPMIISPQPADSVIAGVYGEPISFALIVEDPDGDQIFLFWKVNGAYVSSQTPFVLIPNPTLSNPIEVAVFVTDTQDTTSHVWIVDMTTDITENESLPAEFELTQNYPNPFNPETTISFSLPKRQHVLIMIFNTYGQGVCNLVDGEFNPGHYSAIWRGTDQYNQPVSSGVYYYRMISDDFSQTRKLLLLR